MSVEWGQLQPAHKACEDEMCYLNLLSEVPTPLSASMESYFLEAERSGQGACSENLTLFPEIFAGIFPIPSRHWPALSSFMTFLVLRLKSSLLLMAYTAYRGGLLPSPAPLLGLPLAFYCRLIPCLFLAPEGSLLLPVWVALIPAPLSILKVSSQLICHLLRKVPSDHTCYSAPREVCLLWDPLKPFVTLPLISFV